MPKLKAMPPRLSAVPSRVAFAPDDDQARARQRRLIKPSKNWMKSAWWLKARKRILQRDLYTCRMCGISVFGKYQAHIDHIRPHRENWQAFHCQDDGLQTLCANCHNSKKQVEEANEGLRI